MLVLKRRAETAEGNFVALVGRVQDFRTALRSEIHTMPPGEATNGLSRLSAAMERTIDDSALYMRNIPDVLSHSRSNWEIQAEGGSSEHKRQIRQKSSEPDGNTQKRRKI
jgi:NADH dehydrogenase/NADH:ubiquinone oxidoreductase subunit G